MRGYLLDTSIALLADVDPSRISAQVRAGIQEGPAFLSVIVYWEVMLKAMKGSLDVGDPRVWWAETLTALQVTPLFFRPEHVSAMYDLAPIHTDPFDRALIAQAIVEDLTLLTTDRIIPRYALKRTPGQVGLRVIT